MTKLHFWHPDNLEQFARDCFSAGKDVLRADKPAEVAEKFFTLSNQAFDMAASLRLLLAESGETPPLLEWDADGNDTKCGRFAVGVSTGGYFGIYWGTEPEPVECSDTFKTSAEAWAWCEARAAGADTPVTVGGARS